MHISLYPSCGKVGKSRWVSTTILEGTLKLALDVDNKLVQTGGCVEEQVLSMAFLTINAKLAVTLQSL